MQKSTITLQGVDYIVRTLDVRSIPTWEDECYAEVQVADHALWDGVEKAIKAGDYNACKIDDLIFFYADSDFIRRDPSDEEMLDYLKTHLADMTKYAPVNKPEELDFYTIEEHDGEKTIQLLGYTYKGDNWKKIDVRGIVMPLLEFVQGMCDSEDYVNELYQCGRQYEFDMAEKRCVDAINHYFDGDPADYRLRFSNVNMETPAGNYVNESVMPKPALKVGDMVLWDDFGRLSGDERVFKVFEVREDMVKIASGEPTDAGYSEAEVPWCEVTKIINDIVK